MTKQISKKSGIEIITRQGSIAVLGIISALTTINPVWGVLFAIASSMLSAWGEFGQARTKELVDFLNEHKEEFVNEILESERFKSVFVNILDRQIKEVSKEKRKLFRIYLLNLGKGLFPDFNMDSKLLTILDQITFEELRILNLWKVGSNPYNKVLSKIPSFNIDNGTIGLNEHQVMFGFDDKEQPKEEDLIFILKSLANYGLIDTSENVGAIIGSGSDSIRVKRISPFGKIFLKYITE